MSEATSRDLIERYWKAFEENDLEGWLSCYADDALYKDFSSRFFADDKSEVRQFITEYFAAVPADGQVILHDSDVWADGSRYMLEWTIKGRLEGTFGPSTETAIGAADGSEFEIRGVSIGEIENGLFVHNRDYWVKNDEVAGEAGQESEADAGAASR